MSNTTNTWLKALVAVVFALAAMGFFSLQKIASISQQNQEALAQVQQDIATLKSVTPPDSGTLAETLQRLEFMESNITALRHTLQQTSSQLKSEINVLREKLGLQVEKLSSIISEEERALMEKFNATESAARDSTVSLLYQIQEADAGVRQEFNISCSGVVYDEKVREDRHEFFVLTNHHCVDWRFGKWTDLDPPEEGQPELVAENWKITTTDKETRSGTLKWWAREYDLAVVSFFALENQTVKVAILETDATPQPDTPVVAMGASYTGTGFVSGIRERSLISGTAPVTLIATDATVNLLNTGGGLFSADTGKVVAINLFNASDYENRQYSAVSLRNFYALDPPN